MTEIEAAIAELKSFDWTVDCSTGLELANIRIDEPESKSTDQYEAIIREKLKNVEMERRFHIRLTIDGDTLHDFYIERNA